MNTSASPDSPGHVPPDGFFHGGAELLRGIVDAAPNAMLLADRQGLIVLVNAELQKLFGYTREELLGQPVELLVPDTVRAKHPGLRAAFFADPRRASMGGGRDFTGRRKDGSEVVFEIGLAPIRTPQGIFALATMVDLSLRRAAERALHERTELTRELVESAPNAMILIDERGTIVLVNAQFVALFGYTREELVGANVDLLVPDDVRPRHPALRRAFFVDPKPMQFGSGREFTGRRKDGSEVVFEIGITPIHSAHGVLALAALVDVTPRRRAEFALRESEARFRVMADASPVLIWVAGTDRLCTFFNKPWLEFTGRALEQEIGEGWADVIHPADLRRTRDVYYAAFDARRNFALQFRMRRHDGEYRWLHSCGTPRYDEHGEFAGYVGSSVDITDIQRAGEALELANVELEARVAQRTAELVTANQELEAFCYSVSHDLRAPLRHIGGYAEFLAAEPGVRENPEATRLANVLVHSSTKLGKLIDDLLTFSRIGRAEMNRDVVDLASLVEDVVLDLEPDTEGRDVVWKLEPLPEVPGDHAMLRQVFTNLLGNALKYTSSRPRAHISVRAETSAREVVVHVSDDGVGFDPRYAHKLFQMFQRLHHDSEFEGNGVGLANVKRIVARHGGRVWAESTPGGGACFSFALPRGAGPLAQPTAPLPSGFPLPEGVSR